MSKNKIDEEMKNLHLDKPGKGKSQDQMNKHSVDVSYENKPIDRAIHILTMGDDVQKLSIIQSLPQLSAIDASQTNSRIIPKILQDLPHSSCEIQITTSRVFKIMLQNHTNINILNSIIQGIDTKDPNVAYSWCDALLSVIVTLNEDLIRSAILPIAMLKSEPNQSVNSKILSSKVIGQICAYPKLNIIDIKKDILPLVLSLCQDPNPDVRASTCQNFPAVAEGIGSNFIKQLLLPSLIELACDDNNNVRGAAILAISAMLDSFKEDTKKQTIMPLLKQLCDKSMRKDDTTSIVMAGEIGTLMKGIDKCLNNEDINYLLKGYQLYSQRGKQTIMNEKVDAAKEVMCREKCATNFLVVLEFVAKSSPQHLPLVYGIFKELVSDPCYLVRRGIASNFAAIAKILGDQNKMLKNELVRLLRDDALEVLEMLVPNISRTLLIFVEYQILSYDAQTQVTMDIGRALFKCLTELSKGYHWRLTVTFLQQLEYLPYCMPSEFIHNNFTPVLMDKTINGRAKPIKIQAIRTLIVILRYNFKPNQHKWIRESLIKQIGQSPNSFSRILYVHLCSAVLDIFSEKYFKEFFLSTLLHLASDKIANVRFGVVAISPRIKNMVTLQSDQKTKQMILEIFTKLETSERRPFMTELIRTKRREQPQKRNEERLKEEEKRNKEETSGVIKTPSANEAQQQQSKQQQQAQQKQLQTQQFQQQQQQGQPQQIQLSKPALQRAVTPNRPGNLPGALEMSILNQHFYIDAGVSLPVTDETQPVDDNKPLTVLSDIDTLNDITELNTTNITDDVKVNLRKFSKLVQPKTYKTSENAPRQFKRYSSILSADCVDKDNNRKVQNRRSLNLTIKEASRIPVCIKSTVLNKSDSNTKVLENCDDSKLVNEERVDFRAKTASNLPIFIRRQPTASAMKK